MPAEIEAEVKATAAVPSPSMFSAASRRRELAMWLGGAVLAAGLLVGVVLAMGGRLEAATWGLVVAAAAMVFALRSLYRMALVLSRPPVEVVLEQDDVAAYAGQRELREDRRRLLRAINELQFDYEMGKLSHEDYLKVRQGYELQAVEVIRALDAEAKLHPQLEVELRRRGLLKEEAAAVPAKPSEDAVAEPAAEAEAVAETTARAKAEAVAESTAQAKAEPKSAPEAEAAAGSEEVRA